MRAFLPLALIVTLGLTACADNTPGGKAVQQRDLRFGEIGKAFKGIDGQLKGSTPDLEAIKADAAKIAQLAPQVKDWFPAGSGPQDGKRTDAKAEIWTQAAAFQQAAARLADAAVGLQAAAQARDTAAIAASTKALGEACKGCHDKFKKD